MVSSERTCRAMASGSWPRNSSAKASNPSIVSPEPIPTTPSSVSTRTSVTGNTVRGTGSHAAGKGGSSGTLSRSSRMAVIRIARAVSPTRPDAVLSPDEPPDRLEEEPGQPMDQPSTSRAAVVEFDHVTKHYDAPVKRKDGKTTRTPGAVNDLSLTVPAGKICVLVGPSGCGKTTSLKMVNRLIEPTSGQILIDGEDIAKRDVIELRRSIGYVIQQVGLFPHQTIEENVGTVPRLLGWPDARWKARAAELLST